MLDTNTETTALTLFEQRMLDDANEAAAKERGGSPRLSIKEKKFSIEGLDQGDKMSTVLLHAAFNNTYYKGKYNPKKAAAPDCYALGFDEETLAPPAELKTKVSAACKGCPMNEWGSSDTGTGKACKNNRRIAFISAKEMAMDKPAVVIGEVPPKSLKGLSKYIKNLTKLLHKPTYAVVTTMTFDDDEAYPIIEFSATEEINDQDTLMNIMKARDSVKDELVRAYVRKDDDEVTDEKIHNKKAKF